MAFVPCLCGPTDVLKFSEMSANISCCGCFENWQTSPIAQKKTSTYAYFRFQAIWEALNNASSAAGVAIYYHATLGRFDQARYTRLNDSGLKTSFKYVLFVCFILSPRLGSTNGALRKCFGDRQARVQGHAACPKSEVPIFTKGATLMMLGKF